MNETEKLIYKRRNATLADRDAIHKLILDSYKAGESYIKNDHLHKMSLENSDSYKKRLARSVYISHVKSLIDTLNGFVYEKPIKRTLAKELEYYVDHINQTSSLDSFMNSTSVQASLFTCALLVDSPSFSEEEAPTIADRERLKLYPYVKRYQPFQVRDYSFDSNGKLEWVLFDDSHTDSSDPLQAAKDVIVRTLWTKQKVSKYYYSKKKDDKVEDVSFDHVDEIENKIGEIPVVFVSFRDIEDELYETSFAENIALLDKQIYNFFSLLELLLAKNAIKPLAYPCENPDKIPESLMDAGKLDELVVIPFPIETTNKPFFIEASNTDIQSYVTSINILLEEIKNLIGLNKDANLAGVSGKAKDLELAKIKVLLKQGSKNLEKAENELFHFICLWEGKELEYSIEYNHDYSDEDVDALLLRLYALLSLDSGTLKEKALTEIVKRALPDTDDTTMKKIVQEYNSTPVQNTVPVPGTKSGDKSEMI